jgi:hypothetical protein
MHKILAILKKHWVPIVAIGGGILVWIYLRRSQSQSVAPQTLAQGVTPQYYTQPSSGDGSTPTGSVGVDVSPGATVTQPGTSGSGVPSSSPAIIPYISPTQTTSDPGAGSQGDSLTNPFSNQPNLNRGSDPFGLAPTVPQSGIAAYNGPSQPGDNTISAIQAALTGNVASNPRGGATTVDPALVATLHAASLPGGLAMLPSNNPYLTSDAYTSLQRSIVNGPGCCQVDNMGNGGPNSPCCQVSQATGETATGAPTAASEVYRASVYCEGNHFNAGFFGTAPDTANCTGPNANGSLIGSLIGQYIPTPSAAAPLQAGFGIGNLPPNWNSLTRAQQDAWSQTGVVPPATSTVQVSSNLGITNTGRTPVTPNNPPGTPINPSHPPGTSYLGATPVPPGTPGATMAPTVGNPDSNFLDNNFNLPPILSPFLPLM